MNTPDLEVLLNHLRQLGVQFTSTNGQLHIKAPPGVIDVQTKKIIQQNKEQLIELISLPKNKHIPALDSQKGIWLLQQLDPNSKAYNISGCYEIRGVLNSDAFEKSVQCLVIKHELLRCHVAWINDDVVFVEEARTKIPLIITKISPEELNPCLHQQLLTPFNLERAPLACIYINKVADELFYLHVVIHHLIADAWSCGLLAKDLAFTYIHLSQGLNVEVKAAPYTFHDFVTEYTRYKLSTGYQEDQSYWQKRLMNCPEILKLPTDFIRPETPAYKGDTITHIIPGDRWNTLNHKMKQLKVSEFQLLSSLYLILLHKYAHQEDLIIGYPISGRERKKDEDIFGNLINMLPLRASIDETMTLKEFVTAQQQALLDDWEHQKFPFDKMLQTVAHHRNRNINPLFQHVFVMQNTPIKVDEFEQGHIKLHSYPTEMAKFDLCLSAIPFANGELQLSLEFNNELFAVTTAKQLLTGFLYLMDSLDDQVNAPISALQLAPSLIDEASFIKSSNYQLNTNSLTVIDLFKQIVKQHPSKIAVQFLQQTLTYAELDKKSDQIARTLLIQGIQHGDLIGLCLERDETLIPVILAVLKTGAAYLPLDFYSPPERLKLIVANAKPKFIITDSTSFKETHAYTLISLQALEANLEGEFHYKPLQNHDLAYVIYTSGSTGTPNGVPIDHGNLCRLFHSTDNFFHFNSDDVWTLFHSYAFDFSVWEMWGALLYGGKLIVIPNTIAQNPEAFAQLVCQEKVTVLNQTPSAFNAISSQFLNTANKLRYIILAGEALNLPGLKHWFAHNNSIKIINAYGITETTVFVTLRCITAADIQQGLRSPIGLPIDDLKTLILDKNSNPLPQGFAGELCVFGPGLARGYLYNATLTTHRFPMLKKLNERMYRSGDLVRQLPSGELEYLGRIDKQVKVRGYRIELGEIESALLNTVGISDAAVLCDNKPTGSVLSGYLILDPNRPALTEKEIRQQLSAYLPLYMIPTHFHFIAVMPLTVNGKIDREKLTTLTIKIPHQHVPTEEPKSAIENVLLEIIEPLIGKQVSLEDNFFEIGAHSLLLVHAHQCLKEKLKREIPLTVFFEYPNIKKLAAFLERNPSQKISSSLHKKPCNDPIAIIGIASKVPEANNSNEYWDNLYRGKESIKEIPNIAKPKNSYKPDAPYLPFTAWIEDIDKFDAKFFGISAKEAELMDPQQRILLELAYHAIEDAGYSDITQPQNIGVFVSSSLSRYLLLNLINNKEIRDTTHPLMMLLGNDKDFIATRIAYKLNLQGPALNIQTACSSSLVAIHQAVQSLRNNECELALAGGISINPQLEGYFYEEGGIGSKDGHCRPFDYNSSGTVAGNGGGLVVLKKLTQAIADGDPVYAVLKGCAINNDGAEKVGFVAPSITGQVQVIAQALHDAQLNKAEVQYIETHGTATQLGDAIELAALEAAYGQSGHRKYLGAAKANVGHLDAAAGVTSFIKVVLALHHKRIPPQINFERFPDNISPQHEFTIATEPLDWTTTGTHLRTAAISSFGLGGTNAHAILQEYPATEKQPVNTPIEYHFLLSAKTNEALHQMAHNLGLFLESHPEIDLADVEYTLIKSRAHFIQKILITGTNRKELIKKLLHPQQKFTNASLEEKRPTELIKKTKQTGGRIIALPLYPFAKTSYWINPPPSDSALRLPQLYAPTWKQVSYQVINKPVKPIDIIFIQYNPLGDLLKAAAPEAIKVYPGDKFAKIAANHYVIKSTNPTDYQLLLAQIKETKSTLDSIMYAWSAFNNLASGSTDWETYCLFAPTHLFQTLISEQMIAEQLKVKICRYQSAKVLGTDPITAEAGLLEGIILTIPQELSSIQIQAIDLPESLHEMEEELVKNWVADTLLFHNPHTSLLALRGGSFWMRDWHSYSPKQRTQATIIPVDSTVVISGGSGGIAQVLAPHLVHKYHCRVICLTRASTTNNSPNEAIEFIPCDVSNKQQVQQAFKTIKQRWGKTSAIFHLAGKAAEKLFIRKDENMIRNALSSKVYGARHLGEMAQEYNIPSLILFSSASSLLGGIGELEYCAANQFLDTLAWEKNTPSQQVLSINWGAWAKLGMRTKNNGQNSLIHDANEELSVGEALALFDQCIEYPFPQIAALPYAPTELNERYQMHLNQAFKQVQIPQGIRKRAVRPQLSTPYLAPKTHLEMQIATIWACHLGVNTVGINDNFFELGGDSLTALEMKSDLEKIMNFELNLDTLMRSQTINALIENSNQKKPDAILVQLAKSNQSPNLFCVHAVMGTVFSFIELAKGLEQQFNFFALQSPQLTNPNDVLTTIPTMAQRYIASMKKQQPHGPYLIAGWSFGGLVAYEIARQLKEKGDEVSHLFIIDMAIQSATNPNFSLSEEAVKSQFIKDMQKVLNREVQPDEPEFQSLFHIFQNHVQATQHYFSQLNNHLLSPLNCHCTIFCAAEGIIKSCVTADLGWKPYITRSHLIHLDGDHYSILKSPVVHDIIQAINAQLG
jgi:polyketide synthase PksJ